MTKMICIDEKYSTTRLVTHEQPIIKNKPEDQFESVLFLPVGENRQGEGGLRTQGYFKQSYPDKPLISIITVVFNGEKYLEETIQSVINQSYDNVEYIIIDGGSTDGTVDIIKKYEGQIDYWVSEKDKGIYDAMNKGCVLALGDGINFLNAGDWYNGDVINSKIKIPSLVPVKFTEKNKIKRFTRKKAAWLGMPYCHQGVFFKNRKKLYSELYKISSDYQYFLDHEEDMKFLKVQANGNDSFIVYDKTGVSSINKKLRDFEALKIIEDNFPKHIYIIAWSFIKFKGLFYK